LSREIGITVRTQGNVHVVVLPAEVAVGSGRFAHPLDLRGQRLADLSETLRGLVEQGCFRIVLDLGQVRFLDSAGIGELVAWNKRLREKGGDIRLLRPTERVRNVLELTSLTRVFRIFADEPAALASYDE